MSDPWDEMESVINCCWMDKWGSLCPPSAAERWGGAGVESILCEDQLQTLLFIYQLVETDKVFDILEPPAWEPGLQPIFLSDCTCFAIYLSVPWPAHVLLACWWSTSSERICSMLSSLPPLPKSSNKPNNPQISPFWVLSSRTREPNPSLFKAALDISWLFQRISYPSEKRSWSFTAAGDKPSWGMQGPLWIHFSSHC